MAGTPVRCHKAIAHNPLLRGGQSRCAPVANRARRQRSAKRKSIDPILPLALAESFWRLALSEKANCTSFTIGSILDLPGKSRYNREC